MRCSSFEPLLDGYLEATLSARLMRAVGHHVARCPLCAALLAELRVVDALLTTARAPGSVDAEFTAAVLSATANARVASIRRVPLWAPLALYLALAWIALAYAGLRGRQLAPAIAAFAAAGAHGIAAIAAAFRAIGPATGIVAAVGSGVLILDMFLLAALVFSYRRLRPMLAVYLARGRRG